MGFKNIRIDDEITCIQETGVSSFMRCNIWHVNGRDYDLIIDTGMGLNHLKRWVSKHTEKSIKAIATHSHFDHSGSMHEFSCRLGHLLEAEAFASGGREEVMYQGGWAKIEIVNPEEHPDFSPNTFTVKAAPLTGYLDEGDILDLGNRAFQILHLPGHSPGSIGLYDIKARTLFSGDAIYNGALLDSHPHSNKEIYRHTLDRIKNLDVEIIHAGHEPSFGRIEMLNIVESYLSGDNVLTDPVSWFNELKHIRSDQYSLTDQS